MPSPHIEAIEAVVLLVLLLVAVSRPSSTSTSPGSKGGGKEGGAWRKDGGGGGGGGGGGSVACPSARAWGTRPGDFCSTLYHSSYLTNQSELERREVRAMASYCEIDSILERFDCSQEYSVNVQRGQCKLCREAFREWSCAMVTDTLEDGVLDCASGLMPCPSCASICHQVMRLCPYLSPDRMQFDLQGQNLPQVSQYGGHPAFFCPLENDDPSDPAYTSLCFNQDYPRIHSLCTSNDHPHPPTQMGVEYHAEGGAEEDVVFTSCCWTYASSVVLFQPLQEYPIYGSDTYFNSSTASKATQPNRVILNCCDNQGFCTVPHDAIDANDDANSASSASTFSSERRSRSHRKRSSEDNKGGRLLRAPLPTPIPSPTTPHHPSSPAPKHNYPEEIYIEEGEGDYGGGGGGQSQGGGDSISYYSKMMNTHTILLADNRDEDEEEEEEEDAGSSSEEDVDGELLMELLSVSSSVHLHGEELEGGNNVGGGEGGGGGLVVVERTGGGGELGVVEGWRTATLPPTPSSSSSPSSSSQQQSTRTTRTSSSSPFYTSSSGNNCSSNYLVHCGLVLLWWCLFFYNFLWCLEGSWISEHFNSVMPVSSRRYSALKVQSLKYKISRVIRGGRGSRFTSNNNLPRFLSLSSKLRKPRSTEQQEQQQSPLVGEHYKIITINSVMDRGRGVVGGGVSATRLLQLLNYKGVRSAGRRKCWKCWKCKCCHPNYVNYPTNNSIYITTICRQTTTTNIILILNYNNCCSFHLRYGGRSFVEFEFITDGCDFQTGIYWGQSIRSFKHIKILNSSSGSPSTTSTPTPFTPSTPTPNQSLMTGDSIITLLATSQR